MSPTVAPEQLFDTESDPHEIRNLVASKKPEHRKGIDLPCALLWIHGLWRRRIAGNFLNRDEIVAPFDREMHDWFGTPDWYKKK